MTNEGKRTATEAQRRRPRRFLGVPPKTPPSATATIAKHGLGRPTVTSRNLSVTSPTLQFQGRRPPEGTRGPAVVAVFFFSLFPRSSFRHSFQRRRRRFRSVSSPSSTGFPFPTRVSSVVRCQENGDDGRNRRPTSKERYFWVGSLDGRLSLGVFFVSKPDILSRRMQSFLVFLMFPLRIVHEGFHLTRCAIEIK